MDRESKGKKIRTSSSKEHRTKSTGKPRLESASSEPKSILQMIKENDQKINFMKSRRRQLKGEMEEAKNTEEESEFKEKTISRYERQIKMIEEGLDAAGINSEKLTIMWMAELNISNVIPEFELQIKKKTEEKKQNLGSKMREFASEDEE